MTKVLSQQIENLTPEIQGEVLQYVESLLKKKPRNNAPKRMTLDRFQENNYQNEKETKAPHEPVHYTIW